jgi:hypothetical protein
VRRSPYVKHAKPAAPIEDSLPFSEDELALRFTAKHADELRYVAKWGEMVSLDRAAMARR